MTIITECYLPNIKPFEDNSVVPLATFSFFFIAHTLMSYFHDGLMRSLLRIECKQDSIKTQQSLSYPNHYSSSSHLAALNFRRNSCASIAAIDSSHSSK